MHIAALNEFVLQPESGVKVHPEHGQFAYSDGESNERRVLEILKSVTDLSTGSPELVGHIDDWVTEYHFAGSRANLLRHIPLTPTHRVLELGAGCGSITRFLGESGASITAVEGSLTRAQCARERCRNLENVSIYCGNFQDIAFDAHYDVVTLIGVMEYSPKFFDGDDPIGSCLAVARKALRLGGVLLLAIENKLGLKYFSGATEDHLGDHYAGIEGRYPPANVVTFGQSELRKHVVRAGFETVEFQFPFPDYKVPSVVLFQQGLDHGEFLADELIRHLDERDYAGRHKHEIDSTLVWPQLAANGLLGEFSNSFLVVARLPSIEKKSLGVSDPNCLALTYSTERAAPFQTVTRFQATEDGRVTVFKTRLNPALLMTDGPLRLSLDVDTYHPGRTLHSTLYQRLTMNDVAGFTVGLREWLAYLARFKLQGEGNQWNTLLHGCAFDCLPSNLIVAPDGFVNIDREWATSDPLQLGTLLMRYLFNFAFLPPSRVVFLARFGPEPINSIQSIAKELGFFPGKEFVREFFQLTEGVHKQVFPHKSAIPDSVQQRFDPDYQARVIDAPVAAEYDGVLSPIKKLLRKVF